MHNKSLAYWFTNTPNGAAEDPQKAIGVIESVDPATGLATVNYTCKKALALVEAGANIKCYKRSVNGVSRFLSFTMGIDREMSESLAEATTGAVTDNQEPLTETDKKKLVESSITSYLIGESLGSIERANTRQKELESVHVYETRHNVASKVHDSQPVNPFVAECVRATTEAPDLVRLAAGGRPARPIIWD